MVAAPNTPPQSGNPFMSLLDKLAQSAPPPSGMLVNATHLSCLFAQEIEAKDARLVALTRDLEKAKESERTVSARAQDLQRDRDAARTNEAALSRRVSQLEGDAKVLIDGVMTKPAGRIETIQRAHQRLMAIVTRWKQDTHKALICAEVEAIASELLDSEKPVAVNGGATS